MNISRYVMDEGSADIITTIRLKTSVRDQLKKFRKARREPLEDVLIRLMQKAIELKRLKQGEAQ
jgi:hypothetical protein